MADKKEELVAIYVKRNTRASGTPLTRGKVYRVGDGDNKVSLTDANYLCQINKAESCDKDRKDDREAK